LNFLDVTLINNKGKLANILRKNKNIVYKLSCKDCDATYVGQTKRKLNTKI